MTVIPFPHPNRRADGPNDAASGPPDGEVIAAAARLAQEQHAFATYRAQLLAYRANQARLAEAFAQPEPHIPVARWAPIVWLAALAFGAAFWAAAIWAAVAILTLS